jgi:tRNA A58 N-methylase Trm61
MIHKSNLAIASEILVLDNVQGLLVASALLRSETARVTCMYLDEQRPSMNRYNCLSFLNVNQETLSRFFLAAYADLLDETSSTHQAKYDTILVSTDFEPSKLIPRILPCLKTSGTLAIFSPYLEVTRNT